MSAKELFEEIDELEQAINEECAMDISGVASDLALHLVQEHNYHKQIVCDWVEKRMDDNKSLWKCSNCGAEHSYGENSNDSPKNYELNYCSKCGAKIEKFVAVNEAE